MRDPRFARARAWEQHNRATPEQIENARAKGRAVAEGPADIERLKQASEALESLAGIWQAFHDEFVAAARETTERRAAWVRALGDAFEAARGALSANLLQTSDASAFEGASREWQEARDPFSVWSIRDAHVAYGHQDLWSWGQMLLRIQPEEGLRALDALPYPGLMREILLLFFREDRDAIEELILAAPPVFDEHGRWLPGRSVAALLATDLVTQHARELQQALSYPVRAYEIDEDQKAEAKRALEDLEQRELPAWMKRAFEILLQRPDGKRIGLGYLAHLSRGNLVGRGVPQRDKDRWTVDATALAALAVALKDASLHVVEVCQVWRAAATLARQQEEAGAKRIRVRPSSARKKISEREGEGTRTLYGEGLPFLNGAAVLLRDAVAAEQEIATLWTWFEELLEGRDPGLSLITHGTSLTEVPQRIGFLLSRLPDPDVRIQSAYAKLEPLRRRALFAYRYEEPHPNLESDVLLRVGLNAAANWLDRVGGGEHAEAPRALFFWIFERARRLWLTAVLDTGDTKLMLVSSCFAFMPYLFGDALGEALRQTIPPIANDPRLLTEACTNLRINGLEPGKLRALVADAGADLAGALRDAHQWSELTGRKEDFPAHLEKLAAELDVDLARPAGAPDGERPRRFREAFAAAVPWGASLWQRFIADGCSNVRALPLNEPGNTWVLQATVPEALRTGFGLSPDIRVLAVHGQARGSDLRRAVDEIEGSTDVDPDLLLVASQQPDLAARLHRLAGPWGQRVPWPVDGEGFAPLAQILQEHLPTFDLFERRDPVRGRSFIGRRRDVEEIAARLLRGQAVGVFGLRKVGKSSLLQAVTEAIDPAGAVLATLGARATPLPSTPPEALVMWLDVQGLVLRTRDALAERLWDGLRERLAAASISMDTSSDQAPRGAAGIATATTSAHAPSVDPLDNFRQMLVAALDNRDIPPLCFVVDEYDLLFEGYGGEPAVGGVEQIFALLRSLAQATGRVSLALIGRDPIFASQPLVNGFTNPLLGWVEPVHLGPLNDDDATEMLQRLGKRVGLDVGAATVELALRWTGAHPLLLREYGSTLHELARGDRGAALIPTDPLREQAITGFLRRDAVHTICAEIETLLESRFPDALVLLRSLAVAGEAKGMTSGMASKILFDLGLLRGTAEAPRVPLVYRDFFGSVVPASATLARSQHGI